MPDKSNTKWKVAIGFILSLVALLFVIKIAYTNFNNLTKAVSEISKPNYKLLDLNNIVTGISETENSLRLFSLTNQRKYLNNYATSDSLLKSNLLDIKNHMLDHKDQRHRIDTILILLKARNQLLKGFLTSKRSIDNKKNQQSAIGAIKSTFEDSVSKYQDSVIVDTILTINERTVEAEKGFLKKLFNKREIRKDTLKKVVKATINNEDSLLKDVTNILDNIEKEESKKAKSLGRRELALLEQNSILINEIRSIIGNIEREEIEQSILNSQQSKKITNHSANQILILLFIGLSVCIFFIVWVIRDIKKADIYKKKLEDAKKKAEQLAQAKKDFLANMSHEIRTPLTAIIGYGQLLEKSGLNKNQLSHINSIQHSSDHLLNTVNDILDYSKIEAGKINIQQKAVNLNEELNALVNGISPIAVDKKVNLIFENEIDKLKLYQTDIFRIKQIAYNLIGNAIKFSPDGNVKISAKVKNGIFLLTVKDNGIGISRKDLNTIFQDFQQVDISNNRKFGGTGLGLSISKKIAQLMEGDIKVESELNIGSTFQLQIKMIELKNSIQPIEHIEKYNFKELKILVIDDDLINLQLIELQLKHLNCEVMATNSAKKAIALLKTNSYDIILSDIQMHPMNGLDFLKNIQEQNLIGDAKVVAFTANVIEENLKKYLELGFDAYLLKPFKEKDIDQLFTQLGFDKSIEKQLIKDNSLYYDLKEIDLFTDGDQLLTQQIIASFIKENANNCKLLNNAFKKSNYKEMGEIAHKMLPSASHFHIQVVLSDLRFLEGFSRKIDATELVESKLKNVIKICEKTRIQLKELIE